MLPKHICDILNQAVRKEQNNNVEEAIKLYNDGISKLKHVIKTSQELTLHQKDLLNHRIKQYTSNVNSLQDQLNKERNLTSHQHIEYSIKEDSIGHSYERVFKCCLTNETKRIEIYDPFIRNTHQIQNLVRFVEFVIKSTHQQQMLISLTTAKCSLDSQLQLNRLRDIKTEIESNYENINFNFDFCENLHDREIRFCKGGICRLGRGLDYFKQSKSFSIGYFDMDLRKCKQTTIDIFMDTN